MKIAFTSTGKNWDSPLDSVFGRAVGHIVYNEDKNHLSWFSNEKNRNAGHGAGIQAAQKVADLNVDVLITGGNVGPKAADVLKSIGIKIFYNAGDISIEEAYRAFKQNALQEF
jgi:predicted Fe-Mo cluster-binding NifX family protein